jgi:hypothetical protein
MRHIKTYRLFESQGLSVEQSTFLDKYVKGTWNLENDLVNIEGYFVAESAGLGDFLGIKFGRVSGGFRCSFNNLTSLEGAPLEVGGVFECNKNMLTSLEGAPQKVGLSFYCNENRLTSLEGAPRKILKEFSCKDNQLVSLSGAPEEVGGFFDCSQNRLVSLIGAPSKVGKIFDCSLNKLTSLMGAPIEIGSDFICNNNPLKSLEGFPEKVGGTFHSNFVYGKISPGSFLDLAERGMRLASTALLPQELKTLTSFINTSIEEDPDNLEKFLWAWSFSWFTPSPFVDKVYRAKERGM